MWIQQPKQRCPFASRYRGKGLQLCARTSCHHPLENEYPPQSGAGNQKVWQFPAATGHSGWWRVSINRWPALNQHRPLDLCPFWHGLWLAMETPKTLKMENLNDMYSRIIYRSVFFWESKLIFAKFKVNNLKSSTIIFPEQKLWCPHSNFQCLLCGDTAWGIRPESLAPVPSVWFPSFPCLCLPTWVSSNVLSVAKIETSCWIRSNSGVNGPQLNAEQSNSKYGVSWWKDKVQFYDTIFFFTKRKVRGTW